MDQDALVSSGLLRGGDSRSTVLTSRVVNDCQLQQPLLRWILEAWMIISAVGFFYVLCFGLVFIRMLECIPEQRLNFSVRSGSGNDGKQNLCYSAPHLLLC